LPAAGWESVLRSMHACWCSRKVKMIRASDWSHSFMALVIIVLWNVHFKDESIRTQKRGDLHDVFKRDFSDYPQRTCLFASHRVTKLHGININRHVKSGVVVSPIVESISLGNLNIVRPSRTSFDASVFSIFFPRRCREYFNKRYCMTQDVVRKELGALRIRRTQNDSRIMLLESRTFWLENTIT